MEQIYSDGSLSVSSYLPGPGTTFLVLPKAFNCIIYPYILSPRNLVRLEAVACHQIALPDSETNPSLSVA